MRAPLTGIVLAVLVTTSVVACGTKIGDECDTNADCAAAGLECDTTAPGGYCLKGGCWDDSDCPEDGVCVRFENQDRYCMQACDEDSDCRSGYACIRDLPGEPAYCYVSE